MYFSILDTTSKMLAVAGWGGEVEEGDTFKDPTMLQRLKDINHLDEEERRCVLFSLDAILRDAKTRKAYAK
ncbi:hypothetical protein [Marinoscillum sp.]|uniref:hypothetical protein n=1 Tax=Marinoscillum sp. TaxID=2024838 RepID=UPI003BA9FB58